jgi:tetratricopeptide (TPR) repeat protein
VNGGLAEATSLENNACMWTARPIFISSTFVDMQAERDYLRTRIFPELEERLRTRRHHLEWVDLRVGVATASQHVEHIRELHVLKVCLAEVTRCRPYLIVFIGDRYGWVPAPDRIRAAAAEVGFAADIAGRSVTDIEIDFGVLTDSEREPRCFFYFRDPLPYRAMPPEIAALYSDAFVDGHVSADRTSRLAILKRRIETLMPGRVRRYAAEWDADHLRVTGLEAWGRMVLADMWTELDASTKVASIEVDSPWQSLERDALDDFIEDRSRDFVGRQELLEELMDFTTLAARAGVRGVCVTGEAGSGKSALFGELYRRLRKTNAFVLAHAASASVASPSIDSMLRRWIAELSTALGIDSTLSEDADPETVEITFRSLLGRMGTRRRVIVLVDALDQFETTARGRMVTWLPRTMSANTRLIATTNKGEASEVLGERPDIRMLALPSINMAEARSIIQSICDKYHRTFEPEVIVALLAKSGANGPAWGNPLWLSLAVEELNLLDADDFARAKRVYSGLPGEQLLALMLDITASLSSEIPGLYGQVFERAEELFGVGVARGFLGLIAVGRAGWRERDFRTLLPLVSGEPWDELNFAYLRRLFRGQMRRRGALAQWDFNHGQMREAACLRLAISGARETDLHAMIAGHLLALEPDDPLRQSETMLHLLASEDWARAAHYYGDDLVYGELQGATQILIDTALRPARNGEDSGLDRILRLLDAVGVDASYQEYAAQRLLYHVFDPMRTRAPLDVQEALASGIAVYFDRLLTFDLSLQARLDVHRAASHARLGEVQVSRGRLTDAESSFRQSATIQERLVRDHPASMEWQRDQSVGYNHLGKLQFAQGRIADAEASFRKGLALVQLVANAQPNEPGWQRDLSISHSNLGDAQLEKGDAAGAEASYRAAHAINEHLATESPHDLGSQFDLSTSHGRLWRLQASRGDMAGAEASARSSIATLERLVDREPDNRHWHHALFVALQNLSHVQMRRDSLDEAETSLRAAMSIVERLTRHDPENTSWQRDLSVNHHMLAELMLTRRNFNAAEVSARVSLAISERLGRHDTGNTTWQNDLVLRHVMLGRVRAARGHAVDADMSYRVALAVAQQSGANGLQDHSWLRALALAHNHVAKMQHERGELAAAEASLDAAVAVLQAAVRRDPDNAVDLNNLAACHTDLGHARRKRGDLAGAETSYWAAQAITVRLSDRDPSNAVTLSQLAGCYHNLRLVQGEQGNLMGAQETLKLLRAVENRRDSLM